MTDQPVERETDLFLALHIISRWLANPNAGLPLPIGQLDVLRNFVARTDSVVAAVAARPVREHRPTSTGEPREDER